jgi:flagellar hook-associated protein 1 FlgK
MDSLTSAFDIARGALVADTAALAVTGNNVANRNVTGYTRQIAQFEQGDSVTLSGGTERATTAPVVVTQYARNLPLLRQVQSQTQQQASSSAAAGVLSQVESVFGVSGTSSAGSTALGTALNGLFSSFTALAGNPADTPTRQGTLSAAQTLASTFNAAAQQLQQVGATVTTDLAASVTQVNSLTASIASLNAQIGSNSATASPNADAGALEDQRQSAITQLSALIGLDQIGTEQNGISLTTTGGTVLVGGTQAYALASVTTAGGTQIQSAGGTDVTGTVTGGSIGGQLQSLQVDLPGVSSALDALAYRVATAVNTQNEAGLDGNGNAGAAIFSVPATAAGAAAAISVTATDPSAFAAAATTEGSSGNTNANALAALAEATQTVASSGSPVTIDGQLGTLLGQVGSASATLTQQSVTQQTTLTNLNSQLSSYSSVSLDDEAASLSTYQQSYEASAKLFSILNGIYADAINLGTSVTVS